MQKNVQGIIYISAIIVIAALTRLLPHPPNVSPITALALFSGAFISDIRFRFAIPIAAMLLSDLILGVHAYMPAVYLSFAAIVFLGIKLKDNNNSFLLLGSSLLGSIIFFIVTNFYVWFADSIYDKSLAGLMDCYVMAIPFFRNAIFGDIVYSFVIFGAYKLVERYLLKEELAK
jgi:hypothetical protein